jgi:hypothetical protein
LISHCYSTIDWVIVSRKLNAALLIICDLSLLHFQTVRISPENSFWIEIVIHFPVDGDIFTKTISNGYSPNFNIKLNQTLEEFRRESDSYHCTSFACSVVAALERDRILINKLALLVKMSPSTGKCMTISIQKEFSGLILTVWKCKRDKSQMIKRAALSFLETITQSIVL